MEGIDVKVGNAHVCSSYFEQPVSLDVSANSDYAILHPSGASVELTNNHYESGLKVKNKGSERFYGTDGTDIK